MILRSLMLWCALLLLPGLTPCSAGQAFAYPADDPELRERVDALLEARRPVVALIDEGDAEDAVEALHALFEEAALIAPGMGAILARDLSRAYDATGDHKEGRRWMARSTELRARVPGSRGLETRSQSAKTEISASMSRAQRLQQEGDLEAAIAEFEYASGLLATAPEGSIRPYLAYQLEFQRGMLLTKADRPDDAWRAHLEAERHLLQTDAYQTSEGVMLRVFQLESNPEARASPEVYVNRLLEIYSDPYFADVPERISITGNRVLLHAFTTNDLELTEWIAQEIFHDVARFEETLGREEVDHLGIVDSYTSAASVLGGLYLMRGRKLDAAATLEHALHAYPDANNMHPLRRMLKQHYEDLGMLPEKRTGVFAGPMSLDETWLLQRGGTLPTSFEPEPEGRQVTQPESSPATPPAAPGDGGPEPPTAEPADTDANRSLPALPLVFGAVGLALVLTVGWRLARTG